MVICNKIHNAKKCNVLLLALTIYNGGNILEYNFDDRGIEAFSYLHESIIMDAQTEQWKMRLKESEENRAAELTIVNKELAFQSGEKAYTEAELSIANKELTLQIREKAYKAAELVIANKELAFKIGEKAYGAAEIIIANKELAFQSGEKAYRAAELIITNKELALQSGEKAYRVAELIIANKELAFQSGEKADRAAELIIANKELALQSGEKAYRAAELIIANKELAFQSGEKTDREAELLIANKELISTNKKLIIANKVQGEFLVNISHELKTPLNIISSTAQLFDMYCKSGSLDAKKDSIIKYINSLKQNSYRLSKLINNIVDISKIEAGFFELNLLNKNIVGVIEEIVTSVTAFTESKGLNIIFDTDIEEKIIACDPQNIERVVLNLISNAIKFSNEGGEIFVDVKDKNEFVEISVKDNGIGIEKKNLDMIFDRFKQVDKSLSRNTEGTGIGLSLVKSIVELLGGNIYVESEYGKGSKFTVKLPSGKVINEDIIYSNNVRSENEIIQVELSDIYS